jgi:hypothetical protein
MKAGCYGGRILVGCISTSILIADDSAKRTETKTVVTGEDNTSNGASSLRCDPGPGNRAAQIDPAAGSAATSHKLVLVIHLLFTFGPRNDHCYTATKIKGSASFVGRVENESKVGTLTLPEPFRFEKVQCVVLTKFSIHRDSSLAGLFLTGS